MRTRIPGLALVLIAALAVGADEPLTNEDVVRLVEAGLGEAVIVAKIEGSATDFVTSVDMLVALSKAGVADEVIAAMVKAAASVPGASRPVGAPATPARTTDGGIAVGATPTRAESAARPRAIVGSTFRDRLRSGGEGPEMVVIPAGSFHMGCVSGLDCFDSEKPVHEVAIPRAFALSAHEVTFEDYGRFTYPNRVADVGWGRGSRPVIYVSWDDATEYVAWLSDETGESYRLLSEAEWEYAARAGTTTKYSWGNEIGSSRANCDGCGSQWDNEQTAPVGSFAPNAFGLYDMHGNVWEWVEDCSNASYAGAPSDGGAWRGGDCAKRVLRGGSLLDIPRNLRAAYGLSASTGLRNLFLGFRVARTFTP